MRRNRVGRNDPCPCGSGRKYKRCCMDKIVPIEESIDDPTDDAANQPPPRTPELQALSDQLRQAMESQEFGSLEEAQAFASELIRGKNRIPVDEFEGLSPEQMNRLIHQPFESPDLVAFPEVLDQEPHGPMSDLFRYVIDAIDEKGLKLTPKGNLPRGLSQEAARHVLGEEGYERFTHITKIRGEEDYPDLFATRTIAKMAGLLRKRHGRLFRTKRCDQLLRAGGHAAIYPLLLRTAASRFNWGYRDRYPELWIIQHSFLFTLRMLARHGSEWRDTSFYAHAFVRAFPAALDELSPPMYSTPEEMLARCYVFRALERFAAFCGLAEIDPDPAHYRREGERIRALPLLASAVQFRI